MGRAFGGTIPFSLDQLSARVIEERSVDHHVEEILGVADRKRMADRDFRHYLAQHSYDEGTITSAKKGALGIMLGLLCLVFFLYRRARRLLGLLTRKKAATTFSSWPPEDDLLRPATTFFVLLETAPKSHKASSVVLHREAPLKSVFCACMPKTIHTGHRGRLETRPVARSKDTIPRRPARIFARRGERKRNGLGT